MNGKDVADSIPNGHSHTMPTSERKRSRISIQRVTRAVLASAYAGQSRTCARTAMGWRRAGAGAVDMRGNAVAGNGAQRRMHLGRAWRVAESK